jgi:hypothetical protein
MEKSDTGLRAKMDEKDSNKREISTLGPQQMGSIQILASKHSDLAVSCETTMYSELEGADDISPPRVVVDPETSENVDSRPSASICVISRSESPDVYTFGRGGQTGSSTFTPIFRDRQFEGHNLTDMHAEPDHYMDPVPDDLGVSENVKETPQNAWVRTGEVSTSTDLDLDEQRPSARSEVQSGNEERDEEENDREMQNN